jgi:aminoglycoside phosphotransferase (APT) family kinase protein
MSASASRNTSIRSPDGDDLHELAERLAAFLRRAHAAPVVRIEGLRRLTGGASRQTWSFDAVIERGAGTPEAIPLILRRDLAPGASYMTQAVECRLLTAAHAAGVPVPRVHREGDDSLGVPFFLMERVEGETIARRILRDAAFARARSTLIADVAAALARIHRVPLAADEIHKQLPGPALGTSPAAAECDRYEQLYRTLTLDPHPAFELAFRWLRRHLPPAGTISTPHPTTTPAVAGAATIAPPTLVHGDFRLGNFIVGADGLRAVLDWELAHVGDPIEDLAWLCIRSWRFGNDDQPAAGLASREALWAAYEAAGGTPVDPERARFWELFGNLRWGVICIVQSRRHLDGQSASVELASIGRRIAETEWELLELMRA